MAKIPSMEEVDLKARLALFRSMKEDLRCFRCKKLPRPTEKTHANTCCKNEFRIFCSLCLIQLQNVVYCSYCGQYFRSSPCVPCNFLLDLLPFECQNTKYGCQQILMPGNLFEHEKVCDYMEVNCPHYQCKPGKAGFLSMLEHFESHGDCPVYDKGPKFTLPFDINGALPFNINGVITKAFTPKKLIALQRTFFEVGFERNGFLYLWVYVLASPGEAKNYVFQITMNDGKGHEIIYQQTTSSLNENREDIIKSEEKVFIISVKMANKMKEDGGANFNFSIKLRCLKDEAKDDTDEESGISDNEK